MGPFGVQGNMVDFPIEYVSLQECTPNLQLHHEVKQADMKWVNYSYLRKKTYRFFSKLKNIYEPQEKNNE